MCHYISYTRMPILNYYRKLVVQSQTQFSSCQILPEARDGSLTHAVKLINRPHERETLARWMRNGTEKIMKSTLLHLLNIHIFLQPVLFSINSRLFSVSNLARQSINYTVIYYNISPFVKYSQYNLYTRTLTPGYVVHVLIATYCLLIQLRT